MAKINVHLGDKCRDPISGLEGTCLGISEYMFGCRHVLIRQHGIHEGKPHAGSWFDEPQLEIVERGFFKGPAITDETTDPGGPSLHPLPPAH